MDATGTGANSPDLLLEEVQQNDDTKIVPIPLLFECEALEILTKELTKFNSNYEYRIVYLGPRWSTSTALHKKYASGPSGEMVPNYLNYESQAFPKYSFAFDKLSKYSSFMESYQREQQSKQSVYYRAFEGMNPTLNDGTEIRFDAAFESANLDCAVKVRTDEYDLFLRTDSNTRGHTQWFYFSVSSPNRRRIQLNICNLSKGKMLYDKSMKPYIFSTKKYQKHGTRWQQDGVAVTFEQKRLRYGFLYDKCRVKPYWQLSFGLDFEYADDVIFVAYCIPYTYSQLLRDIEELKSKCSKSKVLQVGTNGRSMMGLSIPILKITDPNTPDKGKKVLLVSGRIHPGQSNGSMVLWGMVQYLCSREAGQLRKTSIFLILPMLNPDGVVIGNTRTGVIGKDLNREYPTMNKDLYPEICNIKSLAEAIQKKFELHMFLDFHGHSQKKNTFVYGPSYTLGQPQYLKSKVLPKLISLQTEMFRYYSCVFRISENKRSTGRAVMFEEVGIPYTYTVESSNGFYYDPNTLTTNQFTRLKWSQMGLHIGEALTEYMVHLIEYEQFMAERRQQRSKKKPRTTTRTQQKWTSATQRKFSRDFSETENESIFTEVRAPPITTVYFVDIIEQIKQDDMQPKLQLPDDAELDSDSCDQKEDMDKTKMEQLTSLVSRSHNPQQEECLSVQAIVIKAKNRLSSEKSQQNKLRDRLPRHSLLPEQPQDEYDLQMDILNEIIEPKLRAKVNQAIKHINNGKSQAVQPSGEHKYTARNFQTISSRGLRNMRSNQSTTCRLRSTVAELARKKRSELLHSTVQEVYSPVTKPYILPLSEDVREPVHFSFRKKFNKSDYSHKSRMRSVDHAQSPPPGHHSLTINELPQSKDEVPPLSPRSRELHKTVQLHYNRLMVPNKEPNPRASQLQFQHSESRRHMPVSFYRIKQHMQSKRRISHRQASLSPRDRSNCLNIRTFK